MNYDDGYITKGLVSVIVPVLELNRPWTLKHRLSLPRSLPDLLSDLQKNAGVPCEVIVVCNSREKHVRNYLLENPIITKFCLNSVNVGVSRSWNMGAMLAEGEFLCFINDDVELKEGVIRSLRDVITADPSIGEVGPQGGKFVGYTPGPRVGLEQLEDADEISGFLFMVRRNVYDIVGGFDVRFTPASYEEIDFSYRVRLNGFRCVVVPKLAVKHHNQGGVSVQNKMVHYLNKRITRGDLNRRNIEIFKKKWFGKEPA